MLASHPLCPRLLRAVEKGNGGLAQCALVVRDGEPAEDGQSAGGVEDGRFRPAHTSARAALVALLVRKRVRLAGWRFKQLGRF